LVHFMVIWYFFTLWYIAPWTIWQPWSLQWGLSCRTRFQWNPIQLKVAVKCRHKTFGGKKLSDEAVNDFEWFIIDGRNEIGHRA
jgi:hypothetical protein